MHVISYDNIHLSNGFQWDSSFINPETGTINSRRFSRGEEFRKVFDKSLVQLSEPTGTISCQGFDESGIPLTAVGSMFHYTVNFIVLSNSVRE